ncbi:MAG: hypothetical protein R3217_10020 [Gammaproteobacteria bacterium]|nr:hypothetical protein [Gammaproteobacteria bacterium]
MSEEVAASDYASGSDASSICFTAEQWTVFRPLYRLQLLSKQRIGPPISAIQSLRYWLEFQWAKRRHPAVAGEIDSLVDDHKKLTWHDLKDDSWARQQQGDGNIRVRVSPKHP